MAGRDDRAEALRRKLAESKAVASEREEFEAGETPVDEAMDSSADLAERRRRIHESGSQVAERMRSVPPG